MNEIKHLDQFLHRIRTIENTFIPMWDDIRLAAKIWLPENAENEPVPAILEYIPYRKRDSTSERDSMMHQYFAGHGYACIRVDLRGSGDSEGVLQDEYLPQEHEDGLEVLRWLAKQPWCNGSVGMIGISWGGFNGLQIAALTPPELKAVITLSSTDDRYADDVHYMGGCLLGDNLSWASVMFSYNSLPPDPQIVGKRWRKMWLNRLKNSGLWLDTWLRHQRRDDYWQHGSINEDYARITCPVFAVSGWADGYSNAVFRLVENLSSPTLGLIGPWSHMYPHLGQPGPAIHFLKEALRFWDKWLKGIETGIMSEPKIRLWMQDPVPPQTHYHIRPGHWIGEKEWPSNNIQNQRYSLLPGQIVPEDKAPNQSTEENLTVQSPLHVGQFGGKWCSYSATPDLPYDQRLEDGGSLVFDSDPLVHSLDIVGAPFVDLDLVAEREVAMVAIRLSDISPDDKARRISYGILNLTHRDSHENPSPLTPGQRYSIRVYLNHIAERLPKGHRFRIAISTSYWPIAWPSPQPVRLSVYVSGSYLNLPIRQKDLAEDTQIRFAPAECARPVPTRQIIPKQSNWIITHELAQDKYQLEVVKDDGRKFYENINLDYSRKEDERYSFVGGKYDTIRGATEFVRSLQRDDWQIQTICRTILTSDKRNFRLRAELDAYEGDSRIFAKSWDRTIPRDLV